MKCTKWRTFDMTLKIHDWMVSKATDETATDWLDGYDSI